MPHYKVHLENYNLAYSPGDEIKGRFECDLVAPITIKCVKVRLRCRERTFWKRNEIYTDLDNQQQSRELTYSGDNDIISEDYILFGSESGSLSLDEGHHIYPFTITLPKNIPPTFHHPLGTITYEIQGIISRPMTSNYKDCYSFKVYAPIDFNKMPRILQEPVSYSAEATVCSLRCQGETISMDLELPKRAFVLSEEINFKVTVSNLSNSSIQKLVVNFTETMIFKATSPFSDTKKRVFNLAKIEEHGVGAHCEHTYNLKFKISECIVPNFNGCSLFSVNYFFNVSCCKPDLNINTEDLIIGHIKWGEEDNCQIAMSRRLPPSGAFSFSNPSAPSSEDLPPSYNEAMGEKS